MNGDADGLSELPRLPDPAALFEARAARLRVLAAGNPAGDFLLLLSRVAAGQRDAVNEIRVRPAPATVAPPLAADRVARDGSWRRMLGMIVAAARAPGLPPEALDALVRLSGAEPAELERIADAVIAGAVAPADVACAPFVSAALQAWFAAAAATLDPVALERGGPACPVCGALPVAGVVEGIGRRRFLSCALCASAWHVPRLQCVACGTDAELAYLHAEGDPGVKAEACSRCRTYVKLFDEEHRPGVEPTADDLATLALDLVLAEEGWRRIGRNYALAVATAGAGA